MKRFGVLLVLAGVIVALGALVASRGQKQQGPAAVPTPTPAETIQPLPRPTFPDVSRILPRPDYTIGAVGGSFPSSVPVYVTEQQPFTQTDISRLATIFHIGGQPTVIEANDGTYYSWPTDPSLTIGPNGRRVDYSATAKANVPLTQPDPLYINGASQLITSVVPWYSLKQSAVAYYIPENNQLNFVSRDKATAIQLSFLPALDGIPVVTGSPDASSTIVRYNADTTLLRYSGYIYPHFVKTAKSTPIIPLSEAQSRLLAGNGSLLSATAPTDMNAHDTRLYAFQMALVTRAELAYYFDIAQNQLLPVYLFYGTATDAQTKKQVDTVSAVSATP